MLDKIKGLKKNKYVSVLMSLLVVLLSNYYLQLSQNQGSFSLATKFAFSWHTEKFLLGSLVLFVLNLLLVSIAGSFLVGTIFYSVTIIFLGIANYLKMYYRMEPIYPDDLKMMVQWTMLKDILGTPLFILSLCVVAPLIAWLGYTIYTSVKLPKKWQIIRGVTLITTGLMLGYASQFNQPNNILRKGFDRTALWIPYSQKMNYYNTGFMGGFLFNLRVDGMEKPEKYSKETVDDIVRKYVTQAEQKNSKEDNLEQPNIIYIMSESFSDPSRLDGITLTSDPLKDYKEVANKSVKSGEMLSQNYGGGTANIEFEALTGMSMALLNPQMTTPYTMMLPKEKTFPSMVSTLKAQGFHTTAIHPYNTSMYKRKDVYQTFGFDTFLDEKTMTHTEKLSKEGFISDESAFNELLDILSEEETPQFIHLVTMQTHMPYNNKYKESEFKVVDMDNATNIENYAKDISYTSEALKEFVKQVDRLKRPTKIIFWGDHLPSIYPDDILERNDDVTSHLTEYLVYDTESKGKEDHQVVSPFYFPDEVGQTKGIKKTGFSELLNELSDILPAFEHQKYYYEDKWQKEVSLSSEQQKIFDAYQLIEYDIVSGERYSLSMFEN